MNDAYQAAQLALAKKVACPICNVAKGKRCVGRPSATQGYHDARRSAARMAMTARAIEKKKESESKRRAGRMGAMPQRVSKPSKPRKPIAKVGKQKPKREAKNRAYYASPEWRAKRKAVFERDGYQCTEMVKEPTTFAQMASAPEFRCPNRGEIVNHKQTARGLVCEEVSYRHRGVEGYIDTCKTRCKECDRRRTPLERANHANGFRSAS